MKHHKSTATANTAYGKALATPITFDFEWDTFDGETDEGFKPLTLAEQVKVRNGEAKANSRSAAQSKAFTDAGIVKPTAENDPQVRLRDMFRTLQTAGLPGPRKYTDEQARDMASTLIGAEWDE